MVSGESGVRSKALLVGEVALFSALLIATRFFKLRLHVPGAGSMAWIAVLIITRGLSEYPATATLVGLISGVVTTVTGIDTPPGPQQVLKYVLAGAVVDALGYLILRKSRNPLSYGVAGGVASLAKLLSVYLIALVLNLPVFVVKAVLTYVAVLNFAFGVVAGVIAFYVVRVAVAVIRSEGCCGRGH